MVESNVVLDEGRNQKDIELKHTTKFARIYRYKHDYAIKIIDIDMTIPPHNPMYELSILQKLKNGDNKHVVTLLESRQVDDDLEMLFPWYNSTLNQYMCDHWQPQTSQPRRRKFNPYYHIEPRPMEDGERSPLTYINTFNVVRYAQDFAIQLLDGLSFIHLNNIIHRDIKPENVLLQQQTGDEGITLVITDFGISYDCNDKRQLNSEPQNNKICDISTSFYKSPEF